ncbi:MAG: hypothetical protein AUK63_973 [bacterium P3]|nr:MAG: hypothetical protein AUK63_973 [bacterium P3]KWW41021.1 MAG: hypothetical protein F083_1188 [bacterium F083]
MTFCLRYRFSLIAAYLLLSVCSGKAQLPLRPDAFPPSESSASTGKALLMADDSASMADWMHYPTYEHYVAMMQRFERRHPALCRLDTIGTSVNGRLILCVRLSDDNAATVAEKPQVFYSAAIHGDELVGFHLMLHLIDTLLQAYGVSPQITALLASTEVYINPLANPDGTYYGGNGTVGLSRRYNARGVDLNRNYPDPFAATAKNIEPENQAMIDYVSVHRFRLSANLHSGSEVMNYPWDSFTSAQRSHPDADWWVAVSKRFVDTCRRESPAMFTDVVNSGYIAGGDWYVITGGRQDYMNYCHDMLEMTMELSSVKKVASGDLPRYWRSQRQALINYLCEVHALPVAAGVCSSVAGRGSWRAYPNPTRGPVTVETDGRAVLLDLSGHPAGIHLLRVDGRWVRVIKL